MPKKSSAKIISSISSSSSYSNSSSSSRSISSNSNSSSGSSSSCGNGTSVKCKCNEQILKQELTIMQPKHQYELICVLPHRLSMLGSIRRTNSTWQVPGNNTCVTVACQVSHTRRR